MLELQPVSNNVLKLVDCHCHLDQHSNPISLLKNPKTSRVFIVGVTNLPSHFKLGLTHTKQFTNVRLSLGLHPLVAAKNSEQIELFKRYIRETSFIGEIGLDFSKEGISTKSEQTIVFSRIAQILASNSPKIISVHSRGAESQLIEMLYKYQLKNIVFHWFTGANDILRQAISMGYYFSVNPKMTTSQKGKDAIKIIPYDRILTESDGPYAKILRRPAMPWDVSIVVDYLSKIWRQPSDLVIKQIWNNFRILTSSIQSRPF